MKFAFSAMVMLLVLVPCHAAEDATDVTPRSSTASATLDIVGPDEAIDVDEEVYLRIKGLTLAEVVEAQDAQLFDLTAFPLKGVKIKASYDWMFRTLDLEFRAKHPGEYLVKLHLVRSGKLEIAAVVVTVGGDSPDPEPDPNPIPPPPGPLAEMWVIVVEETADRTPEIARVLLDPTVRRWIAANGHHLLLVDPDQPTADLAEWVGRVPRGTALPYRFIADPGGRVVDEGELPIGPIQMFELIRKWGTEK